METDIRVNTQALPVPLFMKICDTHVDDHMDISNTFFQCNRTTENIRPLQGASTTEHTGTPMRSHPGAESCQGISIHAGFLVAKYWA